MAKSQRSTPFAWAKEQPISVVEAGHNAIWRVGLAESEQGSHYVTIRKWFKNTADPDDGPLWTPTYQGITLTVDAAAYVSNAIDQALNTLVQQDLELKP